MRKKTLVFDFDGVLHAYKDGWKDGSIYGEINDRLLSYIHNCVIEHFNVCISSVRSAEQIYNHLSNYSPHMKFEVMPNTVPCFWNKEGVIGITNMKPAGVLYFDDRGVNYSPYVNDEIDDDLEYVSDAIRGEMNDY